ncbi:MAG: Flp pilus assembly complex ATPase component TadA [Rhodocyclaceae bacterium]|nr:Flp pilus assembly complex ATPase component TadA [Rhodocyclaceae bacterium]
MSGRQWSKDDEVGVPILDEQHKALTLAVIKLEELVRKKQNRDEIEQALNELVKLTELHYSTEQQLMSEYQFPERRTHIRSHGRLFEDVAKLSSDFHSGAKQFDIQTLAFLQDWLHRHVDEDKKLSRFLKSTSSVVSLVNRIIMSAHKVGASDIHIETYSERMPCRVRFRKDGVMYDDSEIPAELRGAVISRVKIMANLDISERRKPQDGRIDFSQFGPIKAELRVAIIPTSNGIENIVMRLLSTVRLIPIDELGFDPDLLAGVKDIAVKPYGLFLVCGPTGTGKTTTLHSILSYINTPGQKIWTAEDPIEITQHGLCQVQVNPRIGWNFAAAMRSLLRADPDIIMVGEMRDAETTKIAIEASLTGHLVFSTLHTNSAPESIVRLLDLGMDRFSFSDALLGVLAQRLVKRLCEACKRAYVATPEEVSAMAEEYCANLPLDRAALMKQWQSTYADGKGRITLYKAVGCPTCQTGYTGRVAVHEFLRASDTVRRLIQTGASIEAIRNAGITEGMRTLKQSGIHKVLRGQTEMSEVRAACG